MSKQTRNTLLLVLASVIWGTAFAVQSGGGGVGPFTFLAGRSWLAVLFLLGLNAVLDAQARRRGEEAGWPKAKADRKNLLLGGFWCGTAMFAYFVSQRVGITLCSSPSKASFLSTLYVIFVPLLGMLLGRRPPRKIWVSVAFSAVGMYLLCLQSGLSGLEPADLLMVGGGLMFAVQVLTVNHWSPRCSSGVRLSLVNFACMGCWSTLLMLLLEQPTWQVVRGNLGVLLYCGIMSSGVAFTLQIVGQKDLNPAVASLALSLESVFCTLFSWLFLSDRLTANELAGCGLMFAAVLLSQLPVEQWLHKKAPEHSVPKA